MGGGRVTNRVGHDGERGKNNKEKSGGESVEGARPRGVDY